MAHVFKKHYTREEARDLLPSVRQWLDQLQQLRKALQETDRRLQQLLASGHDIGGEVANQWCRIFADVKGLLREFQSREIQVKDLDRGLLDFPAFLGDKEVFLCWERDEEDIEFWHDLNAGYTGREKL